MRLAVILVLVGSGLAACGGDGPNGGSCTLDAGQLGKRCLEYTGSYWTQSAVKAACVGENGKYADGHCVTTSLFGRCYQGKGTEREIVELDYASGLIEAASWQKACTDGGGIWASP